MRTILELLEFLDVCEPDAVDRLCDIRKVGGRARTARRQSLAGFYDGDHEAFFDELRKPDLRLLAEGIPAEHGLFLRSPATYTKDDLVQIALCVFRDGEHPSEYESLDDDDDDDDDDGDDDDDDDDDEDDDDDDDDDDDEIDALLDEARRTLAEFGEVDVDDERARSHRSEWYANEVRADFEHEPGPARRPYQEDAFRAVNAALSPGARPLLHIATGGGKTLVANDVIERWIRDGKGRVLWVTKDWNLLYQAARDLCKRHRRHDSIGRIGGGGSVLDPIPERQAAAVRYTTLQTLARRLDRALLKGVTLLVWDECHWGETGTAWRVVSRLVERLNVAVLGLSATPRHGTAFTVAYTKSFWELVGEGFLAAPEVVQLIPTGVVWNAARSIGVGDFANQSLIELGNDSGRNEIIVRHYVERANQYRQTIVFACGKEHATELAELFGAAGVKAHAIHSDNPRIENREYLEDFRTGRVDVLVNVAMLTHGVDVPAARTVFLARPTLSDILYAQMIGRASRLHAASQKRTFNIVEFTDNLVRFGDDLKTTKRFFAGAGGPTAVSNAAPHVAVAASRAQPDVPRAVGLHRYDPDGAPAGIPDDPRLPEAMRGLWYLKGQTFGFEIELTDPNVVDPATLQGTPRWRQVAEALRDALAQRLPNVSPRVFAEYQGIAGEKSHDVWNVEFDATAGWEVTSRILCDEAGYAEVVVAADAINAAAERLGLVVNAATGLHLHLAWRAREGRELRTFLRLVRVFEPALASIVSPSRIARFDGETYHVGEPNPYCRPISTVVRAEDLTLPLDVSPVKRRCMEEGGRYLTVNPMPLFRDDGEPTVEIRMHGGTTDAGKMLLWLSLWQQILWAASAQVGVQDVPDAAFLEPTADIIELAIRYLPPATQESQAAFLRRLAARRAEVVNEWSKRGLSRWAGFAMGWGQR